MKLMLVLETNVIYNEFAIVDNKCTFALANFTELFEPVGRTCLAFTP